MDPWEGKYETHKATDDVWIRENYPPPLLTFLEAVKRHREYAQPALLDNPNGMIHATFDVDLRTKKKVLNVYVDVKREQINKKVSVTK